MIRRGCLFLVPVCASDDFTGRCAHVWVVGVFGALKSPYIASLHDGALYFALLLIVACKS